MMRIPRRVCQVLIVFCALLLLRRFWIGKGGHRRTAGRHTPCSRVLRLSDSRLPWEESAAAPADNCPYSVPHGGRLQRCLERRLVATGRRTLLVFIGDSRARIHFERLRAELALQWEGRSLQEVFAVELSLPNLTVQVLGSPEKCMAGHTVGILPSERVLRLACDQSASNRLLRAQFFWHTHVDASLLSRLSELAAACDSSRACPDLVVLTSGMWYAKPLFERAQHVPLPQRVLELRRDTATLAERLRPLAARTQLVYRLDPPEMTESLGHRSPVGGVLAAINALMFSVIKQAGGAAQVWTSNLADSIRFYRTVCLPLAKRPGHADEPLWRHCRDPLHVGGPVRLSAIRMLLSFVCRDF